MSQDLYVTHRNFPRLARRVAKLAKETQDIPDVELRRLIVEACECIETQQKHIVKLRGQAELMNKMAMSALQNEAVS